MLAAVDAPDVALFDGRGQLLLSPPIPLATTIGMRCAGLPMGAPPMGAPLIDAPPWKGFSGKKNLRCVVGANPIRCKSGRTWNGSGWRRRPAVNCSTINCSTNRASLPSQNTFWLTLLGDGSFFSALATGHPGAAGESRIDPVDHWSMDDSQHWRKEEPKPRRWRRTCSGHELLECRAVGKDGCRLTSEHGPSMGLEVPRGAWKARSLPLAPRYKHVRGIGKGELDVGEKQDGGVWTWAVGGGRGARSRQGNAWMDSHAAVRTALSQTKRRLFDGLLIPLRVGLQEVTWIFRYLPIGTQSLRTLSYGGMYLLSL